ncbi:MAG: MBL fold metallo-hydrolase [Candidatus Caldarchaeum sp.]
MRIVVLGSGSIVPSPERFGSGLLVETESLRIGVDPGPGYLEKLRRLRVSPKSLKAYFITHFHLDHVADLPPILMLWAYELDGKPSTSPEKLNLVGPKGLTQLVHVIAEQAFPYLSRTMGCTRYTATAELRDGGVWEADGFRAVAAEVEHFEGLAYRFEAEHRSVVFSGDTTPDERLVKLARGCDVLIHECSFPEEVMFGKHTSEKQLAKLVKTIRPKTIVATHLYPAWEGGEKRLENALEGCGAENIVIARDMTVIEI